MISLNLPHSTEAQKMTPGLAELTPVLPLNTLLPSPIAHSYRFSIRQVLSCLRAFARVGVFSRNILQLLVERLTISNPSGPDLNVTSSESTYRPVEIRFSLSTILYHSTLFTFQ